MEPAALKEQVLSCIEDTHAWIDGILKNYDWNEKYICMHTRRQSNCLSDNELKNRVKTEVEMTVAERLSVYEYHIAAAKASNKATTIPIDHLQLLEDSSKDKQKSWLELKAEERDQKRRRQSYKNKASIHTRNKSHSQVIKEVIESQTELLGRLWSSASESSSTLSSQARDSSKSQSSERGQRSHDLKRRSEERDSENSSLSDRFDTDDRGRKPKKQKSK